MAERVPLIYNDTAKQIQELSTSDSIDLSGTQILAGVITATALSTPASISTSITLDNASYNYVMVGPVEVSVGATVAVGSGVSYVVI